MLPFAGFCITASPSDQWIPEVRTRVRGEGLNSGMSVYATRVPVSPVPMSRAASGKHRPNPLKSFAKHSPPSLPIITTTWRTIVP
jgi:hypothetical protein